MGKKNRRREGRRAGRRERNRTATFRRVIIVGFGLVLGLVAAVICCASSL